MVPAPFEDSSSGWACTAMRRSPVEGGRAVPAAGWAWGV